MTSARRHAWSGHADHWLSGERMALRLRRHWAFPIADLMLTTPLVVVGVLFAMANSTVRPAVLPAVLVLVLVGLWGGRVWLRWFAASVTLTDRRIIVESGVFSHVRTTILLANIQTITTRQSVVGRLLSYTTLSIESAAGGPPISFRGVPSRHLPDDLFVEQHLASPLDR